jgi:Ca2+-binding RTX toxin-like protein
MANLTSVNKEVALYIEQDGTGVIGMDPAGRLPFLTELGGDYVVTPTEMRLFSSVADGGILFTGNFASDGTGSLAGISGQIASQTQYDGYTNPVIRYTLTDLNLTVYDYFNVATWSTILSGNDMIIGSNSSSGDVIEAGYGFDTVYGGLGNDYIQGGFNGDRLYGEEGDDDLRGGNGLDLIVGGVGNDTIRGAKGTDTLTGGEGVDVFIFHTDLDGTINVDTITDFVSGVDRIELSAAIFGNAGAVGANVGLSQYITYNAATGVLSYDQDGAGSGAAKAFAILGTDSHPTSVDNIFWITA